MNTQLEQNHKTQEARSGSASNSTQLLYDVGIDLKMIIHWRLPAKNRAEQLKRDEMQRDLNYKAQLFAHEIVLKVNEQGI